MARQQVKKNDAAPEATPAPATPPAPAPAPAPAPTPVVEVKAKKSRAPKAEAVPAIPAPSTASEDVVPAEDVEATLAAQSVEFLSKLNDLSSTIASLRSEYRALEKKWARELKTAQKTNAKRKRKSGNRAPSGFVKPTRISDELAKFLEKPTGTEMARTDVTREINKYIRSNNLQDKDNGRKINPDNKLSTLLKLNKTDELTYFNLQKYMSPHFSKATPATATA